MAKKKQQHRNKKKKNRNQKAASSQSANAADSDRDVATKNYVDSLLTNSDSAMKKYTNLTEEEWANVSKEDMKKVCDKSMVCYYYNIYGLLYIYYICNNLTHKTSFIYVLQYII